MGRLTIGQKALRVLKLLMGLRNSSVAAALTAYGFGDSDLQEGWDNLAALTNRRLNVYAPTASPEALTKLDGFENTWFPIAKATLQRHFPAVEEQLFTNLSQTVGLEVAVSVSTFLDRVVQMGEGSSPFGADGVDARALLTRRGLTDECIADAQEQLVLLGTIQVDNSVTPSPEEQQAAEDALWSWYLEWSRIARVAITDRRLLRGLGFLPSRRSRNASAAGADNDDDELEAERERNNATTEADTVNTRSTEPTLGSETSPPVLATTS